MQMTAHMIAFGCVALGIGAALPYMATRDRDSPPDPTATPPRAVGPPTMSPDELQRRTLPNSAVEDVVFGNDSEQHLLVNVSTGGVKESRGRLRLVVTDRGSIGGRPVSALVHSEREPSGLTWTSAERLYVYISADRTAGVVHGVVLERHGCGEGQDGDTTAYVLEADSPIPVGEQGNLSAPMPWVPDPARYEAGCVTVTGSF